MYSNIRDNKTERLVLTALLTALVFLGTTALKIPVPLTQGYVHLGDAMVYISVLILGRKNGSFAAATGSAMADVLGGFAAFAPWTLIIIFVMAFTTGTILELAVRPHPQHTHRQTPNPLLSSVLAMTAGGAMMCLGYFIAETIMYGSYVVALAELPWNIGQFAAGMVIAVAINAQLKKVFG